MDEYFSVTYDRKVQLKLKEKNVYGRPITQCVTDY
jgi:hypothetical protein